MTTFIGQSIFWLTIAAGIIFVYQGAVLPGIRLKLRYRVFCLRDALRTLAMNRTVRENSPAFQRLHDNLNLLAISLSRVDIARTLRALSQMDDDSRSRAAANVELMRHAPLELTKIYEESVHVFVSAMVFNSLFLFAFVGFWMLCVTVCQVGIRHLKEAFWKRIEPESELAFFSTEFTFSPEVAVV